MSSPEKIPVVLTLDGESFVEGMRRAGKAADRLATRLDRQPPKDSEE